MYNLSLFVNFELVVLGGSTVDELFIALRCASIAAPVPKIRLLMIKYNYRMAEILAGIYLADC